MYTSTFLQDGGESFFVSGRQLLDMICKRAVPKSKTAGSVIGLIGASYHGHQPAETKVIAICPNPSTSTVLSVIITTMSKGGEIQ